MHGFKSLGGLLLVLLITALFLGACGESSTAAPSGNNAAISIKGTSEVTLDTSLSDFLKKNFVGAFTKDPATLPDLKRYAVLLRWTARFLDRCISCRRSKTLHR